MPFGAHETMEVHEILNEKINMINHFAHYSIDCQNQQLRQMIDRHLQAAVQSYDQLLGYTHDYSAYQNQSTQGTQSSFPTNNTQPQQIQYGLNNPAQQTPQMQKRWNDQQIVWAMLSSHKCSAKEHMAKALECADPNLHQMLIRDSESCANSAYEVFLFMNQQGIYQVPTMQDHTAKTFLHSFQPAQPNFQQQNNRAQNNQPNMHQ